jgi:hypothetical protein
MIIITLSLFLSFFSYFFFLNFKFYILVFIAKIKLKVLSNVSIE